jgi:DNA-binding LytR/AlgR family response regulator
MKCLAIDDEPLALDIIREFCNKINFLHLVAASTNPVEAVRILNQQSIDLIFLDIQMPNISGLEFIRSIKNPPLVIFTTAFANYALDGFELNAIDYLVKPFSFERFFRAVNKAYEIFSLKETKNLSSSENFTEAREITKYLMVKVEYSTVKVDLENILYIEGLKDYVKIYSGKKPLLTKSTMKHIEDKLPADEFIRVHKSFIVAFSKIESIENNRIVMGEKRIPIGNQYKQGFYKMLESKKL